MPGEEQRSLASGHAMDESPRPPGTIRTSAGPAPGANRPTPHLKARSRKRWGPRQARVRRGRVEEVSLEEGEPLHGAVGRFGGAVPGPWDDHELVVLAGLHECGRELQRAGRIDVVVEFSHDQHQPASEAVGISHVGAAGVALVDGPTHPGLVPPDFVHAVVVAAAVGDRHVIDFGMVEHGPHGVLPAGAAAALPWRRRSRRRPAAPPARDARRAADRRSPTAGWRRGHAAANAAPAPLRRPRA